MKYKLIETTTHFNNKYVDLLESIIYTKIIDTGSKTLQDYVNFILSKEPPYEYFYTA